MYLLFLVIIIPVASAHSQPATSTISDMTLSIQGEVINIDPESIEYLQRRINDMESMYMQTQMQLYIAEQELASLSTLLDKIHRYNNLWQIKFALQTYIRFLEIKKPQRRSNEND